MFIKIEKLKSERRNQKECKAGGWHGVRRDSDRWDVNVKWSDGR